MSDIFGNLTCVIQTPVYFIQKTIGFKGVQFSQVALYKKIYDIHVRWSPAFSK